MKTQQIPQQIRRGALIGCFVVSLSFSGLTARADDRYPATVDRFMRSYCAECHRQGEEPEEGLVLVPASASEEVIAAFRDPTLLEDLAERLRSQTMPPSQAAKQPDKNETDAVLDWIDSQIDRLVGTEKDPGRVTIRRLTRVDYRNTIRDLLAIDYDTREFPSDDIAYGFDNLADVISLPPLLMERYSGAAEQISQQWTERLSPEDPTDAKDALLAVLDCAFRRPPTKQEKVKLLEYFEKSQSFGLQAATELTLQRILLSPHFLYRIEDDGPIGRDRQIDDFELATRMSYFIWSSMPDDALWQAAAEGELGEPQVLHQQIQRMLSDAKVRTGLVESFAGQWLQTRRVRTLRPDPKLFPEFDATLAEAMARETERLFEHCVREDRSLFDLLDSDFTFVNERLARHYGIPNVDGKAFQKVPLDTSRRRGILTHAGILAMNAHPTRTSPVKRGKWIMEAILGTPPPPPLPGVPDLEQTQIEGTLRERLEQHRSDKKCASCHERMDPLGLAFENFDPVGAWRAEDAGGTIDPSAKLPDGSAFANAMELVDLLRDKNADEFRKGLARNMLIYAVGRKLGRHDRPPLREIVRKTEAGDDSFCSLITAIVESDPFRLRRNYERVGIEKLAEELDFWLTGNPDQAMMLETFQRKDATPNAPETAEFELHTLKPLIRGVVDGGKEVITTDGVDADRHGVFRYTAKLPLNQKVHLLFMDGLLGPGEHADDFLMPVAKIPVVEEQKTIRLGTWDGKWTSDLNTASNPRPGTIYTYSFAGHLNGMGKQQDNLFIQISIGSAANRSVFDNSGSVPISVSPKPVALERVGIRKTSQGGSWAQDLSVIIRARNDLTVRDISPIRFIRPTLGLSSRDPIEAGSGKKIRVFNSQEKTLTDFKGVEWKTILYGVSKLTQPKPKDQPWNFETDHVGARLIGKHADKFKIVSEAPEHLVDDGNGLSFIGADGEAGLTGGSDPEFEQFEIQLRPDGAGKHEATLRIVTQTADGVLSQGKEEEPPQGLYYIDIPVISK